MSTQDVIQHTLSKAAGRSVQFHAFYWGTFELTEVSESVAGFSLFAKATSAALDRHLSFKGEQIYLHKDQDVPFLLAEDIQVFFQKATDYAQLRIYDARPSYEDLFSITQMYVSDFSDPEDFEEVEAYLKFIKGIDIHFDGLLGIEEIKGEEAGDVKLIHLRLPESSHAISLHKELFDIEVLNALNDILTNQYQAETSLHLSIDAKMRMVILKLDSTSLKEARKMGLIV